MEKIPEADYQKAITQLRLSVGGILRPLRKYGQDVFVDSAIVEIVKLAEDFSLRVRGVDKPISLEYIRRSK